MKKIVSTILYVMFFGFAATLVTACVLLLIDPSDRFERSINNIEAVPINGDTDNNDSIYEQIEEKISSETAADHQLINIKYGYQALEKDEKRDLYDKIAKSIYSITDKAGENGRYRTARMRMKDVKMSEFDIREVINAYICDNPEIFWIENLFGYAYSENDTIIEFYSVLSPKECGEHIKIFNEKMHSILSDIKPGMTEYQRERLIHDKVLGSCVYKTGISSASDGWQYFSVYGALADGEAVCEGYAKSMQVLLTRAGIPCSTVRGDADGIPHMWDVVQLGNEWYHLDPTWDDNDKDGVINYEYFNVTTEAILKNHVISEGVDAVINVEDSNSIDPLARYNFAVPMCTDKTMNYYYAEGVMIQKVDEESGKRITVALIEKAQNSEVYIPIRFGSEMPYSEYLEKLFYEAPYQFYNCIEQANMRLDDEHKISMDSVSVLQNENDMTLRVKIKSEKAAA